jgi:AcrR family transcriptional regulator
MYHPSVQRRRWGGDRPADAKERLVDAAETCFDRLGLARTTIDDIAREAHVSRATVYRHVRDRDELVLAVLEREAHRFAVRMGSGQAKTVDDAIVDGIVFALREVPTQPRLALLMQPGAATVIPGAWEVLYQQSLAVLGPLLEQASGSLRDDLPVEEVVEWVLRTVLSLLAMPSPVERDERELRAFLGRFLVPGLLAPVSR